MSIDQIYASQIRDQVGLFASWLPNARIEIGQYGRLSGALFQPQSRLENVAASTGTSKASYDFTIQADRTINADAKALADTRVSSGNVLLEVHFRKAAAVTFSAPDAVITRVNDIRAIGEKLIAMKEKWQRKDAIVVEVITVPRATIIVSEESGAEVKFEVRSRSPISGEAMANLDESSSLRISKGIGAKVVGKGPLTPLFRLAFLKSRVFRRPVVTFRVPEGAPSKPERVDISADDYFEIY